MLLAIPDMAELNPTGGNPKQRKKSAPPKAKPPAPNTRTRKVPAVKKTGTAVEKPPAVNKTGPTVAKPPATMGRMERTRRLLLAALRVWELKRRPMD